MNNKQEYIDGLSEALKLVMLEDAGDTQPFSGADMLAHIVNADYAAVPDAATAAEMVNKLYDELSVDSLGHLISNSLGKAALNVEQLAVASNLPVATVEQLQADRIVANSIPVISLKNLLKLLKIPFDTAQEAINKSFQMLKSEIAFSTASIGHLQLSYRRRTGGQGSSAARANRSEIQYLFQNEEAMQKYLTRLQEVYEK